MQFAHVERQVGIGVEHEVTGGGGKACLDRTAELAIDGVVHDLHPRVGGGEGIGHRRCGVGGGIVDDDQLVVADRARLDEFIADLAAGSDGAFDVGLFVPHGEEDGEGLHRAVAHGAAG